MDGNNAFVSIYKDYWKKAFDYKGTSTLREYWLPVGFHIGLLTFSLLYYLLGKDRDWPALPFWVVIIFLLISLVPFVALTVRRLKDTGLSGLWALLLLFVGAGTCVVLALCAAGSGFTPFDNLAVSYYGPPPSQYNGWDSTTADPRNGTDPAETEPQKTEPQETESSEAASRETDPSETELTETAPVETRDQEMTTTEIEIDTEDPFDPSDNIILPLYGPPPFEEEEPTEEDDYFDPSGAIAEPLYGPPAGDVPTVER